MFFIFFVHRYSKEMLAQLMKEEAADKENDITRHPPTKKVSFHLYISIYLSSQLIREEEADKENDITQHHPTKKVSIHLNIYLSIFTADYRGGSKENDITRHPPTKKV